MIVDGCDPVYVLQADKTLGCQTGQPIRANDMYPDLSLFPALFDSMTGGNLTDQSAAGNATDPTLNVTQPPMPIPTGPMTPGPMSTGPMTTGPMFTGPMLNGNNLPQIGGMQGPNQDQYNSFGNFLLWDLYLWKIWNCSLLYKQKDYQFINDFKDFIIIQANKIYVLVILNDQYEMTGTFST